MILAADDLYRASIAIHSEMEVMAEAEAISIAGVDAERLRSFVERIETLDEEIKGLNDDKASIYEEAAAVGLDKAAMKVVIRRRRKNPTLLASEDYVVTVYERALETGESVAPAEAAKRHETAYAAGFADGQVGSRDGAPWASGEYGHADYEIGWDDGHAATTDATAATPRARARARRPELMS